MQEKRVALVIAVAGGVGQCIALNLVEDGFDVVGVYRSSGDEARKISEQVKNLDGHLELRQADVTQPDQVKDLVEHIVERYDQLDVLVNTQGWHTITPFHHETLENIEATISIEFRSVLYLTQAVLEPMLQQGWGRIITVGSDSGRVGSSGLAVSSGCRGGVIGFSKAIAREVARNGITVNVVAPGPIDTPAYRRLVDGMEGEAANKIVTSMTKVIPMKRLGTAEEVAAVVRFLTREDAGYVTGQTISVSGGMTMI